MKGNEFLEKINNIDDKLIEKASTSSKNKIYIKWGAIAACFVIVVSITMLMYQQSKNFELPMLTLSTEESGGMGYEGYLAYNIDDLKNSNPWNESLNITHLPVINNSLHYNKRQQIKNQNIEKMKLLLTKTAKNLGMNTEELLITDDAPNDKQKEMLAKKLKVDIKKIPKEYLAVGRVFIEDENYKVSVDSTLTAEVDFKTAVSLPDEYNFSNNATYDDLYAVAKYLKNEYSEYIGMENPIINISPGDYFTDSKRNFSLSFYEGGSNDIESLINYNFTYVTFHSDDSGNLFLSRNYKADLSDVIGNYPIISTDDALKLLENKNFITTIPDDFPGIEYVKKIELVYRNGTMEKVYVPYYRIYVEIPAMKMANGLNTYGAYYVPAIDSKYIENMPLWDGEFN